MRLIGLTHGKFAQVDDDLYDYLTRWRWAAKRSADGLVWYAARGSSTIRMHRVVLDVNDPTVWVDHRDSDGLNNQRSNLRICDASQSACNRRIQSNNSSGYRGVYRHSQVDRWCANIKVRGKMKYLGIFETSDEAAEAYDRHALIEHGEFARLNFPVGARP